MFNVEIIVLPEVANDNWYVPNHHLLKIYDDITGADTALPAMIVPVRD